MYTNNPMARKRVLVTGSSRGIGQAIAQRLAADGWKIAVHCSTNLGQAQQLAQTLGDGDGGVYAFDLADPQNAEPLWKAVLADGSVDAIVNNAGAYLPIDFVESGDASFRANWHKTFAVNLESPAILMRLAAKEFVKNGHGKILNVASRVGFRGEGGAAIYAASKAGIINLTRSLAVELASKNVGVFAIAPGWVDTAMVREGMESKLPAILDTIPLGRMATPEDCAAVAAFLLREESSYLSGMTIDINGASYFH